MEKLHFFKYQGTGNDFIIFDNRQGTIPAMSIERIKSLCDRRFGIGADGLMLLNTKPGYDFEMKYYNSDGRESTMCGNGGRCMARFARDIGMHKNAFQFLAADGPHEAEIDDDIISLKMKNVPEIKEYHGDSILDTGSPHYVKIVGDVMDYDVYHKGMDIRYSPAFAKEGINVNFVEQKREDEIIVRTYERGVEDETLSCGTGVTAAALVCYHNECGYNDVTVITKGGKLTVRYDCPGDGSFENIWLCGPASRVFEGTV
ncbi:MAG TPA: diaminopimelate epimerase [Puia sp.]|nr:diaminopimelate epimerase [Puia sp.]